MTMIEQNPEEQQQDLLNNYFFQYIRTSDGTRSNVMSGNLADMLEILKKSETRWIAEEKALTEENPEYPGESHLVIILGEDNASDFNFSKIPVMELTHMIKILNEKVNGNG
ncbi:hypothetical protein [Microviridae sp.]|nr:hypothetical protein [Microviridae sp.]